MTARRAGSWQRTLLVPGIVFCVTLSGLLCALMLDGWMEALAVVAAGSSIPVLLHVLAVPRLREPEPRSKRP